MELAPLTILIGLNGSGKTTILQAFDFTAQLMNGQVDSWLLSRNWTAADLYSKLSHSNAIFIGISIETKKSISLVGRIYLKDTYEIFFDWIIGVWKYYKLCE